MFQKKALIPKIIHYFRNIPSGYSLLEWQSRSGSARVFRLDLRGEISRTRQEQNKLEKEARIVSSGGNSNARFLFYSGSRPL